MQWFRMWAEAVDDEKLKLLAFEDRWHFVAILCCKRKGILDAGDTPALRDRKIGAKLGVDDRVRDEVKRRLMEVGLIDDNWQPKGWDKRQFVSDTDPTAKERKQRQREKQRHGRVTRDNRDCHGPVTDESLEGHGDVTGGSHRSDSDTDSESEVLSSSHPPTKNLTPDSGTSVVAQKRDGGPVERVFDHWRSEHKHPKAVLDPKRRRVIEAALKAHDEPTLCTAISGYRNSPHHMGENDQRTVYDDIELFLRDAKHIEAGLRFARGPPAPTLSPVAAARQKLRDSISNHGRVVSEQTGQGESSLGQTPGMLR